MPKLYSITPLDPKNVVSCNTNREFLLIQFIQVHQLEFFHNSLYVKMQVKLICIGSGQAIVATFETILCHWI